MNAIDLPALRGLLTLTETEIAETKTLLRRTWTRPMAAEQRTLVALKLRATHLYVVRALMRGRLHMQQRDRAHHEQLAEHAIDRYRLGHPEDLPCLQTS
jgi:hypothetical protein